MRKIIVHNQNQSQSQAQQINQAIILNKKYDEMAMYPAQKRLVAIGDLSW